VMVKERPVFPLAIFAYALSCGLTAASNKTLTVPGYYCAAGAFVAPFAMDSRFVELKTMADIAVLISGWINIAFLVSLTIRWRSGNGRAFRILRVITLLMVPFCWIVFYDENLFPREGHVLWIVAMVFALFSDSLSSSREVPAASTS
jgi:hypothetical protein